MSETNWTRTRPTYSRPRRRPRLRAFVVWRRLVGWLVELIYSNLIDLRYLCHCEECCTLNDCIICIVHNIYSLFFFNVRVLVLRSWVLVLVWVLRLWVLGLALRPSVLVLSMWVLFLVWVLNHWVLNQSLSGSTTLTSISSVIITTWRRVRWCVQKRRWPSPSSQSTHTWCTGLVVLIH